jgi:hypothetical protein
MYSRSGIADASAKNVIIASGQSCPAPLRPDSLNLRGAFHRYYREQDDMLSLTFYFYTYDLV